MPFCMVWCSGVAACNTGILFGLGGLAISMSLYGEVRRRSEPLLERWEEFKAAVNEAVTDASDICWSCE